MAECYRARGFPALGFDLRWAGFQCDDPACSVPVHKVGLIGFDFDGVDRWIPIVELIDFTETDAETSIDGLAPVGQTGWELLAAAFGLPWDVIDLAWVRHASRLCWELPEEAGFELAEQGVEGMFRLRELVGRSDLSVLPYLLVELGRYRENVGGSWREWSE